MHWSAAMVCPQSDIFSANLRLRYTTLTLTILGIAIIFVFCLFFIGHQLKPLGLLAKAAQRIKRGDFSTTIPQTDRTDEAAPAGDADDGNGSGAQVNGDVAETPASNDTTNTNAVAADGNAAGQNRKDRAHQNSAEDPDNSRMGTDESSGQKKDGAGDASSEDSSADDKDAGSTDRTDSQAEDSYGSENSAPDATPEALAEDAVEQKADGKPASTNGAAVIIVLILAAALGGVYYYNRSKHSQS